MKFDVTNGTKWRVVCVALTATMLSGSKIGVRADEVVEQREKNFNTVWETVQRSFYDPKLNGLDWEQVRARYAGKIKAAKTRSDVKFTIKQMLGELKASHLDYVLDDEAEYYSLLGVRNQDLRQNVVAEIGVTGETLENGYQVRATLEGSPAQRAGLQRGDLIVLADGSPFHSVGSFVEKSGRSVILTVKRGEVVLKVDVTPERSNMLQAFLVATQRSVRVEERDGLKLGYVHLWTMANPAFRETLQTLVTTRLHDTDGLILDLRDGYGGMPFGYSDVFFRPDVDWATQGRSGRATTEHTGYNKPLIVLTNDGTRSAKEFLTYQLKTSHRATIVGERTAGAFLGATFVPVGKEALLELAEIGLLVDGKRLEKSGVAPDIAVMETRGSNGKDAILQTGWSEMERQARLRKQRDALPLKQVFRDDTNPSRLNFLSGKVA